MTLYYDMQPINREINRTKNNMDFLRLFAAFSVLIYHSFLIVGKKDPLALQTGNLTLGAVGVAIFFVISGYLITKSWCGNPSAPQFLWNRVLRIVPGLVLLSVFTVFIIGPLATAYPLIDYFTNSTTWGFFRVITVFGIYPHTPTLPGVFLNNLDAGAVNGNLWSLPIEFAMYLVIMLSGLVGLLGKKRLMACCTAIMLVAYVIFTFNLLRGDFPGNSIYGQLVSVFSSLGIIILYPIVFLVGSLFYLYRDKITYDYRIMLVVTAAWLICIQSRVLNVVGISLCFPYVVLYIAQLKLPYLNKAANYGDFSYGMYIYGATIQQTFIVFFPGIDPPTLLALSSLVVLPLAFLSWHIVESRALQMKRIDIVSTFRGTLHRYAGMLR